MTLSIRIRTSEDVRASKRTKFQFYLLSATFQSNIAQPRTLFLWMVLCKTWFDLFGKISAVGRKECTINCRKFSIM